MGSQRVIHDWATFTFSMLLPPHPPFPQPPLQPSYSPWKSYSSTCRLLLSGLFCKSFFLLLSWPCSMSFHWSSCDFFGVRQIRLPIQLMSDVWWAPRHAKVVFFFSIYLFIFGCAGSLFPLHGLSLIVASGGYSLLQITGSRHVWTSVVEDTGSIVAAGGLQSVGSIVMAHRLSCSEACVIFPDLGWKPCSLHWQVGS